LVEAWDIYVYKKETLGFLMGRNGEGQGAKIPCERGISN